MATLTERIAVINSAVRTVLAVIIVGGLGTGAWWLYREYYAGELEARQVAKELELTKVDLEAAKAQLSAAHAEIRQKDAVLAEQQEEISQLQQRVEEQQEQIDRLDTAMRLLKVNHRVAQLVVLDQTTDEETGEVVSRIQFQELDDQGRPVDEAREFSIRGDMVYLDSWVVKFDDKYVEQADLDRSTSLVLFRRIFGEHQEPSEGYVLDQTGSRPAVYGQGTTMSAFEKRIWDDFWNVANDERRQEELGIRAAHGDAPSIKVRKGKAYRIELRASDGLSITPLAPAAEVNKPAA